MSSEAQIAANRQNAQLSTGPSSDAGKDAVRFNAVRHGVYAQSLFIPGEDPAEFEALAARYHRKFQPVDPVEEELVNTLIQSTWRERRLARIEAELITHLLQEDAESEKPSAYPLGAIYLKHPAIDRIIRHREAATRAWDRALRRLLRLRTQAATQPTVSYPGPDRKEPVLPAADAQPPAPGPIPAAPEIGFVPEISAPAPQVAPRRDPPWLKRPKTARPDRGDER